MNQCAFWGKRCKQAGIVAVAVILVNATGCSLLSFRSPERPLSARDLNARILTREYSAHFIAAVEKCADDMTANERDSQVLNNTLRLEIGAATQSVRAATQIAPMISVLDTWALALQMKAFVDEGDTGGALFGLHQDAVRALAAQQADRAMDLARQVIAPKEFPRYRKFVEDYVREYPIEDLKFTRAPIVELWSRASGADAKLVDSLGTIPEAMSDFADRLQIYGDALPSQTLWKTELALRQSGYSRDEMRLTLEQLENRLDRMAVVAEHAPELVHGAVADVRKTMLRFIEELSTSSASLMLGLRAERVALTADVRAEREAALVAIDEQRKALALDAATVSDRVVKAAGQEIRRLAREVLLLLLLLIAAVLGLPFAAGYFVGRGRRRHST